MRCVIVTGMSGAGKSTVLKFLEDVGYFCVDNLPPSLIPKFIDLCSTPNSNMNNVAIGVDIRGGRLFGDLSNFLSEIKNEDNKSFEILYLDSENEVLLKRYKESRRQHPLNLKGERLIDGIKSERRQLENIKKMADYIIDTSHMLTRQLRTQLSEIFLEEKEFESLMITVLSFGFKYGIPSDADLVFDVRFIPNPFYIDELKPLTGNDVAVRDYVMQWEEAKIFRDKLTDLCEFLIPNYIKEGKNQLVIAIGCTGGKHRSVTLANELYNNLKKTGHSVIIAHRDIDKDAKR
ncbi:MAG: RNase adapter RapZ [Clostridia bacterium]|nr:RNase adapter RapZ [Clostridia bacterium]